MMKKKIFQEAFIKAENQCGNNTKHGLSNHLEKVFMDDLKFSVNKITFVRYYEKYIENNGKGEGNPNSDLLNKIAEYLGFINYEDFVSQNNLTNKERNFVEMNFQNESSKKNNLIKVFIKKNRVTILVSCLLLIGFTLYYSFNKQRWMIWEENQYKEVKFDTEKYNIGELKLYNQERIKYFKKVTPDCNTEFFSSNGEVKIWYGKNKKKELEFFAALGLHPETGKTLDPITLYMIKKYICKKE
jgi:hypothetical protein